MTSRYFDSTYLFKIQCVEQGTELVRACGAEVECLASGIHGRAEFASACHRKIREGFGTPEQLQAMLAQIEM